MVGLIILQYFATSLTWEFLTSTDHVTAVLNDSCYEIKALAVNKFLSTKNPVRHYKKKKKE